MVHEVAVGAALAVWAPGVCGVTVKFSIAISKLQSACLATPLRFSNFMVHHEYDCCTLSWCCGWLMPRMKP